MIFSTTNGVIPSRHCATLAKTPAKRDRYDGYLLEYRNPVNGGPTMTTIQCAVQLLPAKEETQSHRHTSTVMYHVFRGQRGNADRRAALRVADKATLLSCRSGTRIGISTPHPTRLFFSP